MIETDPKNNDIFLSKIKSIPILNSVNKSSPNGLFSISKIREYKSGEMIIKEGSFDNYIYYLFSGRVKFIKNEKEIGYLRRTGDVFGEMAAIDDSPRSASVIADGKTVCILIDTSYLDKLSAQSQIVNWRSIAETLTARLRKTTEDLTLSQETIQWLQREIKKLKTPTE